jgi:PAS domain S-box-containing protein
MGDVTLSKQRTRRRVSKPRSRHLAGRFLSLHYPRLIISKSPEVPLYIFAGILTAVVFAMDVILPLGVGIGVLYTGVVLLSLWSSYRRFALIAAATVSVLIVLEFFKSETQVPLSITVTNRLLALAVVWLTAILLPLYQHWRARADETRAHLAALVESCGDAIISKTLDGVVKSWNIGAERLFGYTAPEAIGNKSTILIPPDCLEEERHIDEQIRRGERIEHLKTVRQRKDGTQMDVCLTISPIIDGNGTIIGISKIARDISEEKSGEEERNNLLLKLVEALDQIKTLRGMLPICAACHKIRNDEGYWDSLETYLQAHSEVQFTHGLCPQCLDHLYPTLK